MVGLTSFVGREPERLLLAEAFARARQGKGGMVVIGGEPGVGKTRLARELAAGLEARAVWSRCWALSGTPPFWAFRELLRGLEPSLSRERTPFDFERAQERPSGVDPRERFAMFEAVCSLVLAIANEAPFLWVVDDLHAADLASLELLEFIAPRLGEAPVLIVATCRSVGRGTDADAERRLTALARHAEWVSLGGLPADAIGDLVLQQTGERPTPSLAAKLAAATRGNPFFLDGVIRAARTQNGLATLSKAAGGFDVAADVVAAIEQRVTPAGTSARMALEAASVLGAAFEASMVATVAGLDSADTEVALSWAQRERLLEPQGSFGERLSFAHQLIQEVVYRGLSRRRRRQLHRAAIDAYEEQGKEPNEDLLRHYLAAGDPSDRAFQMANRLAIEDRRLLAYEAASRHFRIAESLASDADRGRVLLGLGDAELLAGSPADARQHFREALLLARRRGDAEGLANAAVALSRTVEFGVLDLETLDALEEALRQVSPGRTRVLVSLRLAEEMWIDEASRSRRETLSSEALAQARELGDDAVLARALAARMQATWGAAHASDRATLSQELMAVARRVDDLSLLLEAGRWKTNSLWERGRAAEGDDALARYVQVATRLGSPHARTNALLRRVIAAEIAGRLDEIETLRDRLVAAAEEANHPQLRAYEVMPRLLVDVERESVAEVEAWLGEYLVVAHRLRLIPAGVVLPAYTHLRAGNPDEAQMHLERAMAQGVPAGYGEAAALSMLAQVAVETDADGPLKSELYARLLPFRGLFGVAGLGICFGSVERYLGQLARSAGDIALAREHFEAAVQNNLRGGVWGFLAHSRSELAEVLRRTGDLGRADALDAQALRFARSARFTALERRLESSPHRAVVVDVPTASPARVTLARDGDGWCVTHGAVRFHLKDRRGLGYLARLVSQPGVTFSALELAADGEPDAAVTGAPQPGLEMLDAKARAQYRARLVELREEERKAVDDGQVGAAKRARVEREFLEEELLGAVGIGGRARKRGGHSERARVSVTNALRRAITAIAARSPALAANLRATLRTGAGCVYQGDAGQGLLWVGVVAR